MVLRGDDWEEFVAWYPPWRDVLARALIPARPGELPLDLTILICFPGWPLKQIDRIGQSAMDNVCEIRRSVQEGGCPALLDIQEWPNIRETDGDSFLEIITGHFHRIFPEAWFWHHAWRLELRFRFAEREQPQ
jgi:hypothetical protein